MTVAIGQALAPDEIADWFVNRVFLGQGCFGVAGASIAYFGKPVEALGAHEVACLAVLPKGPAEFHPVRAEKRAEKRAVERRNWLLAEMADAGVISAQEARDGAVLPLGVRLPLGTCPMDAP